MPRKRGPGRDDAVNFTMECREVAFRLLLSFILDLAANGEADVSPWPCHFRNTAILTILCREEQAARGG
jgi:tRNA G26 N,N-dimethylase Trm1